MICKGGKIDAPSEHVKMKAQPITYMEVAACCGDNEATVFELGVMLGHSIFSGDTWALVALRVAKDLNAREDPRRLLVELSDRAKVNVRRKGD